MNLLARQIAGLIRTHVEHGVRAHPDRLAEWRSVFHGPPLEFLAPVFDDLTGDGGIIVEIEEGRTIRVPVLLQADTDGKPDPELGQSGRCSADHLLNLRNTPGCPKFVALVPPGGHTNLSFASASAEFGIAAANNSGNATINDWLADDFIEYLIELALDRLRSMTSDKDREEARRLIRAAAEAADQAEWHEVSRLGAWRVLSRVFMVPGDVRPAGPLSLACGFPPTEDGTLAAADQTSVLGKLAARLEENGIALGLRLLGEDAPEEDVAALESFSAHLQRSCELLTAMARAGAYYYAPARGATLVDPPEWWSHLTVEKWNELLQEEHKPEGALRIECTNRIFPPFRGGHSVVQDEVDLTVSAPEAIEGPISASLVRMVGGKTNTVEWTLQLTGSARQVDKALPLHRTPARYTATTHGVKKATIKVISLATWEPGFFLYCPTARKIGPPKAPRVKSSGVAYDCTLALEGSGRHYITIYCRPTVEFEPKGRREEEGGDETTRDVTVSRSDARGWGFEAEVGGECHYDLRVRHEGGDWEIVRVYLNAEESTVEGCKTEFDRLIRLNRQRRDAGAAAEVQLDRSLRCADLQGWILAPEQVERSFEPLVMSSDYSARWASPKWGSRADTILSAARFLHDPRPAPEEFNPPAGFREARKALAARISGNEGNGLAEGATLGAWLLQEDGIAELLQQYLDTYHAWIESDPDVALWADVILICGVEPDRATLRQDPHAILLTPLHPIRLAWQALAQRILFQSYARHEPCPAASILDPDAVPDVLALPIRTAAGAIVRQPFLSLDCSSDYWSVLWNGRRLDSLTELANEAPLDPEFGIRIGGISSGFSSSQVRRSLDDVAELLAAKPVLSVMVSSSSGHTNACNEGISAWCKERLGPPSGAEIDRLGPRTMQILDLRPPEGRPQDAEVSNLAEDTENAVKWYGVSQARRAAGLSADLGIIAQLEISNLHEEPVDVTSALGWGALLRHRVRRQLPTGDGSFLAESRVGASRGPTGDALADKLAATVSITEASGNHRAGFTFAPSVHAISEIIGLCDFAAVSSSAVDPACFLGKWLPGQSFLWDYDLPSYSHRSGDTNGYYLISKIKQTDRDALAATVASLPGGDKLSEAGIDALILEVARRGIPTVRGLSAGVTGAAGDLGLFVASRLLQDAFRAEATEPAGLLPIMRQDGDTTTLALIIPVDPFRGYLNDLRGNAEDERRLRPDLLVAGIRLTTSSCRIRLTPLEVKFRTGSIGPAGARAALEQARALASLFRTLETRAQDPALVAWRLTMQHLLSSMLGFGFRVYSQQRLVGSQAKQWTEIHFQVIAALFSGEAKVDYEDRGRLLLVDNAEKSGPRDFDEDTFYETLCLSGDDAATILFHDRPAIYDLIAARVGDWGLLPQAPDATPPAAPERQSTSDLATETSAPPPPMEPQPVTPTTPTDLPLVAPSREGIRFEVGQTIDGFRNEPRFFHPSDTNLNQLNVGVVGDLGTGKTQLLKALLYRLTNSAEANRGLRPRVLVFDYKRDYSDPEFVAAVGARVVKPQRLPVNVFDLRNSPESLTPWLDRFNFFSDVMDKVYKNIGPIQRRQLKNAVKRAYDEATAKGRQPTIYDVSELYAEELDGKADSPSSILDDMVDRELFHREPEKAESFDKFLDGIVVIDLAALGQDDRAKNMLVAIMLNLFYEHMLRIPKRPYDGTDPQLRVIDSFLLVDEADNIMRYEFDVLRKVLLQGREFGVGVILASQYLRHFKAGATDYREPLLTWFIHKVPNIVPNELQALGMTMETAEVAERIKQLPKHCCLYKTEGVAGDIIQGLPFYRLRSGRS